ncbi:hypothetical protein HHK36_026348 [Tetracentron sinense]|uniref:Proteasome assembly chaperone 4 n=1 Tax=Tetracentron sinense TaxID=13715 RepID=A0A835D5D8_TETSI|nr:hypothetical protein HHK36_026348 [Tetracentron sinense]
MASGELDGHVSDGSLMTSKFPKGKESCDVRIACPENGESSSNESSAVDYNDCGVHITCFTEVVNDVTLHFQIIRLEKQIYAWIGCNSAKFGHLYAATHARPSNTVGVTSILGGASDNTGSSIARRLVLKTGRSIILACNIPKNSPLLEVNRDLCLSLFLSMHAYTHSVTTIHCRCREEASAEANKSWIHKTDISRSTHCAIELWPQ